MKAEDLKTKTPDELNKLLLDLRKEQFNLRFQKSGGSLDKTSQVRKTRRSIARAKTFLNAKTNVEAVTSPKTAKAAPKKAAPKTAVKTEKAKETKKADKKTAAKG